MYNLVWLALFVWLACILSRVIKIIGNYLIIRSHLQPINTYCGWEVWKLAIAFLLLHFCCCISCTKLHKCKLLAFRTVWTSSKDLHDPPAPWLNTHIPNSGSVAPTCQKQTRFAALGSVRGEARADNKINDNYTAANIVSNSVRVCSGNSSHLMYRIYLFVSSQDALIAMVNKWCKMQLSALHIPCRLCRMTG